MKLKHLPIAALLIALALLGLAVWLVLSEGREDGPARALTPVDANFCSRQSEGESSSVGRDQKIASTKRDEDAASTKRDEDAASTKRDEDAASTDAEPDDLGEADEPEPPKTPEEQKEAAEEAAVESFDNLTDKWMAPTEKGVAMADVDAFVAQFKKVPRDRQEECLQRALNLVPDENVMLLAGVLMDKSQPKELVELVFNDVLNRDEAVKAPILQQVFKDKAHPCWADTAWILDVTGEKQ